MTNCVYCRGKVTKVVRNHLLEYSGLESVLLVDANVYECSTCKESSVEIRSLSSLLRAIQHALQTKSEPLTDQESAWLRKYVEHNSDLEPFGRPGVTEYSTEWKSSTLVIRVKPT